MGIEISIALRWMLRSASKYLILHEDKSKIREYMEKYFIKDLIFHAIWLNLYHGMHLKYHGMQLKYRSTQSKYHGMQSKYHDSS